MGKNVPKNQSLVLTRYIYRLTYSKKGRAKFISHLDLMRTMQRAFKRAKLPVWYTQGFNPHPYIMFPLALALGTESEIEPMDIALLENYSFDEVKNRLNEVLPVGLRIEAVAEPVCEHTDVLKSEYLIEIETKKSPEFVKDSFVEFLNGETVEISKRTRDKRTKKVSFKNIDVKEHIELLGVEATNEAVKLELRLSTSAGNTFNLNFSPVLEAFARKYDIEITHISANRTKILCKNGQIFS